MAKRRSKTLLAFGDVHVPHHHPVALEVLCRAAERIRPDVIVCLGDLLDCGQFSAHPPTWGMPQTEYLDDLNTACALLDRLQATCRRLVLLESNHEYRLDRWAAATAEGRGAYSMLAPRLRLTHGRQCLDIRYSVHTKRDAPPDAPRSMRVEYRIGQFTWVSEWVCFEHGGYARWKAKQWWRRRSPDPVPETAERAVEIAEAGGVAWTEKIVVRTVAGEKYDRIVGYTLAAKPEPVPIEETAGDLADVPF